MVNSGCYLSSSPAGVEIRLQVARVPGQGVGIMEVTTLAMDFMREQSLFLLMGNGKGFLEDTIFEVGLEVDRAFIDTGVDLIRLVLIMSLSTEIHRRVGRTWWLS